MSTFDFKVGDTIKWATRHEVAAMTITAIGDKHFLASARGGMELTYRKDVDWVKVEPKQTWTITTEFRPAQYGERYFAFTTPSKIDDELRPKIWEWFDNSPSISNIHVIVGMVVRTA